MASRIISSQSRSAGTFSNVSKVADPLWPSGHASINAPMTMEKIYIRPDGNAAFGQWNEFDLPRGALAECYLEADLGALTSGNYAEFPGLGLIDEVELRDGNSLQSFRYSPVMKEIIHRSSDKMETLLRECAGGTSHASGKVISPLPLFFSKFLSPSKGQSVPLLTELSKSNVRLRLKLRSAADISDSGATTGTPTLGLRLYCVMVEQDSSLRDIHSLAKDNYVYKSCDWQTPPQSESVAASTSTSLDYSSLYGVVTELSVFDTLVADVDTNHDYISSEGDITNIKVRIDGSDFWDSTDDLQIQFDNIFAEHDGSSSNSETKSPAVIPFAISHDPYHYTGGLATQDFNSVEVVLTHEAGAACYIDCAARVHAYYTLENGRFVRKN